MLTLEHRASSEEGKQSKYFKYCHMGESRDCCGEVRDEARSRKGEYQGLLLDKVTSNLLSPRPSLPSQITGVLPLKYKTKLGSEDALLCIGQGGRGDLRNCCLLQLLQHACLSPGCPG